MREIDTLRLLSVEAIEAANSGHPGLPLGAAPMAWTLWSRHLRHNPMDTEWPDRDRFVLSAGHGSALLYSLLHLFGYDVSIEDLKAFRQMDSLTPGHPEYGHTPGVELTTGPLGAGISMAVGMAMAEEALAAQYNKEDLTLVDHFTYVLCGDGDLMEGISNEASSLAGTQKLSKLIVLYDSNNISIEGSTDIAFTENVRERYEALGWDTFFVADGNDVEEISQALDKAKTSPRPALIEVKTKIGFGSPREGMAKAHGEPLGRENIVALKENLGFDAEPFTVPQDVQETMNLVKGEMKKPYDAWMETKKAYKEKYPEEWKKFQRGLEGEWDLSLTEKDEFFQTEKDMATRASSGKILNRLTATVPELFGGSADLAPSNKTEMDGRGLFSPENRLGRNIPFGVREHAMAAVANGIALHGGFHPYCATFLVFSDYLKPQIRLSALMGTPVTYVFTHDSIGVGEDGPTHQPVDQLPMLRSIPNVMTFRPADYTETAAAWTVALSSKATPVVLALSRQTLPELEGTSREAMKGGYVVHQEKYDLELILIATGSELQLAVEAAQTLEREDQVGVRVVSLPCRELFEAQPISYQQEILPPECKARISVEAGSTFGWKAYTGLQGREVGIDTFGASGPAEEVFRAFDITVERIIKEAGEVLA